MMLNIVVPRFDYDKASALLSNNPLAAKIYLLKTPIDPAQIEKNCYLLFRCMQLGEGFLPVIKHLISQKFSVNQPDPNTKDTALHHAVRQQNIAAVELLLGEGAIQLANNEGETPLYDAVRVGTVKLINILLEHNNTNDLKLINKCKQSALDCLFIEADGRRSVNCAKNTFKPVITAFIQRNMWPTSKQINHLPMSTAAKAELMNLVAHEALKKDKIALALDYLSDLQPALNPSQVVLTVMEYGSVQALQILFDRDKKYMQFDKNILHEPACRAARANNINMLRHIRSKLKMLPVTPSVLEAAVQGDAIDVFCYLEQEFLQDVALSYIEKLLGLAISYQADKVFEYFYKNYVEKYKDQATVKATLANFKQYNFKEDNSEFLKKYFLIIKQQNIVVDKIQFLIALIITGAIKSLTWFLSAYPLESDFPIEHLTAVLRSCNINEIKEFFSHSVISQIESAELDDAHLVFVENLIKEQLSIIREQHSEKFTAIVSRLKSYQVANKLKIINLYCNQIKILLDERLEQSDFRDEGEFEALLALLNEVADSITVLQVACDVVEKKTTARKIDTIFIKKIAELYFGSSQNKKQMRTLILATNNLTLFKLLANIAMIIEDKEEIDFWLYQLKAPDSSASLGLLAAAYGPTSYLVKLIQEGRFSIEEADDAGETALFYAARASNRETVEYLVQRGLSVTQRNKKGQTLLHCVVDNENGIMQYLEEQGLKYDECDDERTTALNTIVSSDAAQAVEYLLENNRYISSENLIVLAITNNLFNIIDCLCRRDLKTLICIAKKAISLNAYEVLHYLWQGEILRQARAFRLDQIIPLDEMILLAFSANAGEILLIMWPAIEQQSKQSLVFSRAITTRASTIILLLRKQQKLTDKDCAFIVCDFSLGNDVEALTFMHENELLMVVLNQNKKSALHNAVLTDALEAFVYLVSIGLSLNIRDAMGNLPLHHAAQVGSSAILGWYANNNKLNFESNNNSGQTVFDVANEASKRFLLPLFLKSNSIKNKEVFKAIISEAAKIASLKIILIDCLPKMAEESYRSGQFDQGDTILDYLKQIAPSLYYDKKLSLITQCRVELLDEFCLEIIDPENTAASADCKKQAINYLIDSLLKGEQLLHDQLYGHLLILYKNNIPNFDERDTLKYALFHYLRAVQGLYYLEQLGGEKDEQREQKFYLYLSNCAFPKFGSEPLSVRDWTPEAAIIFSLFHGVNQISADKRQAIIELQLIPHLNKLTAKPETLSVIISNNSPLHQNSNSAEHAEENIKSMSGPDKNF